MLFGSAWLLLMLIFPLISASCSEAVYVHGRVVDAETGAPIPGIVVILQRGSIAEQRLSAANGQWMFGVRPTSSYRLSVRTGEAWALADIICPAGVRCRQDGGAVVFPDPGKGFIGDFVVLLVAVTPPPPPTPTPEATPTPRGPYDIIPIPWADRQSILEEAWRRADRGLESPIPRDDPTVLFGVGDMLFGLPRSRAFTMTLESGETVRVRAYTTAAVVFFPDRRVGWPLPFTVLPWDSALGKEQNGG